MSWLSSPRRGQDLLWSLGSERSGGEDALGGAPGGEQLASRKGEEDGSRKSSFLGETSALFAAGKEKYSHKQLARLSERPGIPHRPITSR